MSRRESRWKFTAGCRPHTVTVCERKPGGVLYARCRDPNTASGRRVVSLGHRDRDLAKRYAIEQAAALQRGADEITSGRTPFGRIVGLYVRHRTPRKSLTEQRADQRKAKMWLCVLGSGRDPNTIVRREWESFIRDRGSGAINARGEVVAVSERKPVGARAVQADLKWLRYLLGWAADWQENGQYLLAENPVRGFEVPQEKNPARPIATVERYEALRAVSDDVTMEIRWNGRREVCRSYLSEVLDICNETGRRITAVLSLRRDNVQLDRGAHGLIEWPADTDKQGRASLVPVTPTVRAAIERRLRDRPTIGRAYLFPSPSDPNQPIKRRLALAWLRRAERLAGLEHIPGGGFHMFRRKWATERKDLSAIDVAAAGGWAAVETLQRVYQTADQAAMLEVVMNPRPLREAR